MIKRELAKDPALANENWERFLPKFEKKNVQTKKPLQVREKKPYTPFPPAQQPRKIDEQVESGEYFLNERARVAAKREEKREKAVEKTAARKRARAADYEPVAKAAAEEEADDGAEEEEAAKARAVARAKRAVKPGGVGGVGVSGGAELGDFVEVRKKKRPKSA